MNAAFIVFYFKWHDSIILYIMSIVQEKRFWKEFCFVLAEQLSESTQLTSALKHFVRFKEKTQLVSKLHGIK